MSKVNKLGKYKGVEVELAFEGVTDEEVKAQLDQLVASREKYIDKEGTVEEGDTVTFDFEGFKDGVPFDGGKAEGYSMMIGSHSFIPGFEEGMVGMAIEEERDLDLTFPENYGAADLAGQDVVFKVKVHKIQTRVENELNDEFVKELNQPGLNTVEDLEKFMKINLQQQKEDQFTERWENMVLDAVVADSDVEVTEEEVEKATNVQIQMMRAQTAQMGMELEQYLQMMNADLEALKAQLRPNAEKQAVFEAIIEEIIKLENIETPAEDAELEIEAIAKENNVTVDEVKAQYSVEMIQDNFNKLKASRFIIENAVNKAV